MRSFIVCTHQQIFWGFREENAYEILSEDLKERDHFEKLYVGGKIILKCNLKKNNWRWNGFIWFRIRTTNGPL
jgi:hypothetical protein